MELPQSGNLFPSSEPAQKIDAITMISMELLKA